MATRAKVQSIVTRKGMILEVVGIDGMISMQGLSNWITSSKVEITTVRDPNGKYPQSKNVFVTREWSYVVDLASMKVVSKYFGSYGGGAPSITALNKALDDINGRL